MGPGLSAHRGRADFPMVSRRVWLLALFVALLALAPKQPAHGSASTRAVRLAVVVDGILRTALVIEPADAGRPAPLIVAFHGRRGDGESFDRAMRFERRWPEAVVAYPDGLPGRPGSRTDPEGRWTGWQVRSGDVGDADLAFFDALMAQVRDRVRIDPDRIYLVGRSNGSRFVGLLLARRGRVAAGAALLNGPPGDVLQTMTARSLLIAIGAADPVFPRDEQYRSVHLAERRLGVPPLLDPAPVTRRRWGRGGLELEVHEHRGGHQPPPGIAGDVVAFFRRHVRTSG